MKKRLIIYAGLTFLAAISILHYPRLNFGGIPQVSMFQQFVETGDYRDLIIRFLIICALCFIGLVTLFGLGDKNT